MISHISNSCIRKDRTKAETIKAVILSSIFLIALVFSLNFISANYFAYNYLEGHISTINNIIGNLNISGNLHVDGNVSMKRPYGMFSDMNIQTVPVIKTAYNMTFNFTEDNWEIIKQPNNYTFTSTQSGDYLIQISIIAQCTTPGARAYIWLRKNNVDVPRSTTIYDFKSSNANAVIAVPFIIDLNMWDNFSIQYAGDNTGIKIMSYNKTTFAPETPGAIMTINKISEIPSM